jgi:hypothetical protein
MIELLDACKIYYFQHSDQRLAVIDCPTVAIAINLAKNANQLFEEINNPTHVKLTLLSKDLYPVIANPGLSKMNSTVSTSGYQGLIEKARGDARFITWTEHLSHRCLWMNNQAEPDRLILTPQQYCQGSYNFFWSWRDSLGDLDELLRRLKQDRKAENFTYRLRRPDGSLGEYTKDYYLREVEGLVFRESFSLEWRLVEPAPIAI